MFYGSYVKDSVVYPAKVLEVDENDILTLSIFDASIGPNDHRPSAIMSRYSIVYTTNQFAEGTPQEQINMVKLWRVYASNYDNTPCTISLHDDGLVINYYNGTYDVLVPNIDSYYGDLQIISYDDDRDCNFYEKYKLLGNNIVEKYKSQNRMLKDKQSKLKARRDFVLLSRETGIASSLSEDEERLILKEWHDFQNMHMERLAYL